MTNSSNIIYHKSKILVWIYKNTTRSNRKTLFTGFLGDNLA